MSFELRVETYGTDKCTRCGAKFTKQNPCWNDDGNNGDLHIDGICTECENKSATRNFHRKNTGN